MLQSNAKESYDPTINYGFSNLTGKKINLSTSSLPAHTTTSVAQQSNTSKYKLPLTPKQFLAYYSDDLSDDERKEVLLFPEIYYWGQNMSEKDKQKKLGIEQNSYPSSTLTCSVTSNDDAKGFYKPIVSDHLAYRYEIIENLGKGSFGQVFKCFDHRSKEYLAVKVIRNKKRFSTQAKIEIRILKDLRKSDTENKGNFVTMIEDFRFRSHICIVFEMLSINLYEFIKSNNFSGFSLGLIRRFTTQILQCLCLLWRKKNNTLRFETRKYIVKNTNKEQYQSHRFWIKLLYIRYFVDICTIEILSCT